MGKSKKTKKQTASKAKSKSKADSNASKPSPRRSRRLANKPPAPPGSSPPEPSPSVGLTAAVEAFLPLLDLWQTPGRIFLPDDVSLVLSLLKDVARISPKTTGTVKTLVKTLGAQHQTPLPPIRRHLFGDLSRHLKSRLRQGRIASVAPADLVRRWVDLFDPLELPAPLSPPPVETVRGLGYNLPAYLFHPPAAASSASTPLASVVQAIASTISPPLTLITPLISPVVTALRALLSPWTVSGASFTSLEGSALLSLLRLLPNHIPIFAAPIQNLVDYLTLQTDHSSPDDSFSLPRGLVTIAQSIVENLDQLHPPSIPAANRHPPRAIHPEAIDINLWVDASTSKGIGVCIGRIWAAWAWKDPNGIENEWINWAEVVAVELGIRLAEACGIVSPLPPNFSLKITTEKIVVRSDSTTACRAIRRMGSQRGEPPEGERGPLSLACTRIEELTADLGIELEMVHVPGTENKADGLSRGRPGPDEYRGPDMELPEALKGLLVAF